MGIGLAALMVMLAGLELQQNANVNARFDDLSASVNARFDDLQEDIRALRALIVDVLHRPTLPTDQVVVEVVERVPRRRANTPSVAGPVSAIARGGAAAAAVIWFRDLAWLRSVRLAPNRPAPSDVVEKGTTCPRETGITCFMPGFCLSWCHPGDRASAPASSAGLHLVGWRLPPGLTS